MELFKATDAVSGKGSIGAWYLNVLKQKLTTSMKNYFDQTKLSKIT